MRSSKDTHLIFCSFVPVGLEDYVRYFEKNFKHFTYLRFKFPHSRSNIKSSLDGKDILTLPAMSSRFLYFAFLPFYYLLYLGQIVCLLWGSKTGLSRGNYLGATPKCRSVFMGVNHFCALGGIILKKLGRVDFVIYRVMDFFPLPSSGVYRLINRVFYLMDGFCLKNADSIWFTTKGHIRGRENQGYFNSKDMEYQMIPLGLDISKFVSRPLSKIDKNNLVYCGVISRYHLLDMVFEIVVLLKKDFPKIKLNLIGSGPDEEYFKNLAKEKGLSRNIEFHGFVPDGDRFKSLMSDNVLGIALYKDEEDFMKYTEPAKVKSYLSFGVPALVSDVPQIARELDVKRVAFAVQNDKNEIYSTIKVFLSSDKMQREYKENIKKYVKTIDINKMLEEKLGRAFEKIQK